jgi:23S rRNA pseudouridine955/2504/2580 synthase
VFDAALRNELADSEPAASPSLNLEMQTMVDRLVQRIVYKDDNFLVLNKPHGLAVQDGSALAHSLSTYLPAMGAALESETPRLVHRLDKDTSGLLVLARHRLAAARFSEILRSGGVQKTYEALVRPLRHTVEIPPKGEISLAIDNKPARTLFRRLHDNVHAERSCWLEMQPVTGRKHQLRIHCALGLHAPIVGDLKYGPRERDPRERLFLHAKRLLFADPFRPRHSIDVACEMDKLRTDVPTCSGTKSTKKRPTIKKP